MLWLDLKQLVEIIVRYSGWSQYAGVLPILVHCNLHSQFRVRDGSEIAGV